MSVLDSTVLEKITLVVREAHAYRHNEAHQPLCVIIICNYISHDLVGVSRGTKLFSNDAERHQSLGHQYA